MNHPIVTETRNRMQKTVDDMSQTLATIRTGRASIHLLDNIYVDYYGTPTPLNQLATLHAPEPNLITIQPWDVSQFSHIEKAIQASDLGLNPNSDGKLIRLPIPPLTEERRQLLARQVGKIAEDHRTSIRQIRRDSNDQLKKMLRESAVSEDEERRLLEEVQKVTDEFVKKIDELATHKETEIVSG